MHRLFFSYCRDNNVKIIMGRLMVEAFLIKPMKIIQKLRKILEKMLQLLVKEMTTQLVVY